MDSYTLFEMCYEACCINFPELTINLVKENAFDIAFYSTIGTAIYATSKKALSNKEFVTASLDKLMQSNQ